VFVEQTPSARAKWFLPCQRFPHSYLRPGLRARLDLKDARQDVVDVPGSPGIDFDSGRSQQFSGSTVDTAANHRLYPERDKTVDSFVGPPTAREQLLTARKPALVDRRNQKSLGTVETRRNPFPERGDGYLHGEHPFRPSELQELRPAVRGLRRRFNGHTSLRGRR